jgi:hypothetical protein
MNILVVDQSLHCATTGTIMCILQFINYYRKKNNILIEDINNIYIKKSVNVSNMNCIFDDNMNKDIFTLFFTNDSSIENVDYNNIYLNIEYNLLAKKIKFSKMVIDIVNKEMSTFENTLGIHFRFTDMNKVHLINNPNSYNGYLLEILNYVYKYKINNIFIASDNDESIHKITNHAELKHINFIYRNNKRYEKENADDSDMYWHVNTDTNIPHSYLNNFKNIIFNIYDSNTHLECILDCILLSKCNHLIFSHSNVSYLSILLSENIKNKSKISEIGI